MAAFVLALHAHGAGVMGAAALRSHYATIAPRLATSEFGAPLLLQSEEGGRRIDGEAFATLDQPFATVAPALAEPSAWCEILILHLNTKSCRRVTQANGMTIEVRIGKKEPQAPEEAQLLAFRWAGATKRADYVAIQMEAGDCPYGTQDCRLFAEVVPLEGGRTFLHMGYAFSTSALGSVAMKMYLATVGRGKIGFTRDGGKYIAGARAIAERNTMRYYLGIEAYFASLAQPRDQQLEKRMALWFDSTERYARQLHELDRDDYLKMKREELKRPQK